nr:probable ATP-dependent RNA helicase spindle-E [Danaus plexippus plexippus]
MEELKAFFNNPCPSNAQVIKLRGPLTGGQRITKDDPINDLNRREEHRQSVVISGTDYAREVKLKETEMYLKNERERENFQSISGGLDSMEQLSSWGASFQNLETLTKEAMTQVYNKYSFQMKEDTKNLAINAYHDDILDRIKAFPVVIIEGPTGCGKTTQVPQWILDDAYNNRKPCKIVVTQPRKIAAISISRRVAQERGWDVGGLVGYQVGLENRTSNDTRIHYVTTGVLLQKLVNAKNMNEYTHVVLDEVHEREQDMDFLLLVVKKLLYTVSPSVKVILMSATFNCRAFADYFLIPTPAGLQMSSCLKVTNDKPAFTVKTFYLNHLTKFGAILQQSTPKSNEPVILPQMYHLVVKLVNAFENIDKQEEYSDRSEADLPSVLIFLPGIHEIEELYASLMDIELRKKVGDEECSSYKWWVLPLHSTITADEQVRVFQRAPPGHRKIILATNIAESSITVPDIKYVIDFCLMKVLVADENTNFTSLQLSWASKTNCEQRAGRAGRVRDGRVYRLVHEKFYDNLPQECKPEIIRCPLERLVLLSKMLDMGTPSDILALAMDPPDMSNIHRTILVLKEVGALKKTMDGEWCVSDGDITHLGRIMAKLPLDVRVSKLILLGYIYGCLEEAVVMAAGLSVKNVFSSPFRERLNAYNSKLTWADGSTSDCIALLNVYKVWNHLRQQKYFKQQGTNEVQWARRFYVQVRALRELDDMVKEIRARLSREGIQQGTAPWNKQELPLVLKVVLAGAFYPQYFTQASTDESRERDAVKVVGGLDPRGSVYLRGLPDAQPAEIYQAAVRAAVHRLLGDEPRVTVDRNSRKIYLTFQDNESSKTGNKGGDPTIPGQVLLPVYKAVKARQLKMDVRIPLLPLEKAIALSEAMKSKLVDMDLNAMVPSLPDIDDTHFALKISQFINVGKFWVQHDDESTRNELREIQRSLNSRPLLAVTGDVAVDDLVTAPYADGTTTLMYRARIIRILPRDMLEVLYIDYGSAGRVSRSSIRVLPQVCCRPLALCCRLAGLAPAPLLDSHTHWSQPAQKMFTELVGRGRLIAKVYSVTHGVVSIELLSEGGKININKELLDKGYAVPCEESYDSKLNHDLREMATDLNLAQKRAYNKEQTELAFTQLREVEAPVYREYTSDVSEVISEALATYFPSGGVRVIAEPGRYFAAAAYTLFTLVHAKRQLPADGEEDPHTMYFINDGVYGSFNCVLYDHQVVTPELLQVNHIRHLMDYMLYCSEGQESPAMDDELRVNVPKYIREDLMQLLLKRRKHRETESVVNAWEWKSIPEDELLEITIPDMVERAVVYSLHLPLELRPKDRDTLLALKRDNDDLKMRVSRSLVSNDTVLVCKLCGSTPMPVHSMRIHLSSNSHRDKEEDFKAVLS